MLKEELEIAKIPKMTKEANLRFYNYVKEKYPSDGYRSQAFGHYAQEIAMKNLGSVKECRLRQNNREYERISLSFSVALEDWVDDFQNKLHELCYTIRSGEFDFRGHHIHSAEISWNQFLCCTVIMDKDVATKFIQQQGIEVSGIGEEMIKIQKEILSLSERMQQLKEISGK